MVLRVEDDGSRRHAVTTKFPLPTFMPSYEDVNGLLQVQVEKLEELIEVMERIQQQLSLITGVNLHIGESIE